jgi:hypothetical protein
MALQTGANKKLYIAITTGEPANQAAYEAITNWTEIEDTESIGEFGDESADVTFLGLGDGRVQHLKGSRDAGTQAVTFAFKDDAYGSPLGGQGLMLAAAEDTTNTVYNFKVSYEDSTSSPLGHSTRYFGGFVGTFREAVTGADNVLMVTSDVRINTPIVRVNKT